MRCVKLDCDCSTVGSLNTILCTALDYRCISDLCISLYATHAFLPDEDDGSEVGQFQKEVEALPPELRHYIQEDNWRLEQEAEEWEEEQSCKIPQMEPSAASESQDLSSESGLGDTTSDFVIFVETNSNQLVIKTAFWSLM